MSTQNQLQSITVNPVQASSLQSSVINNTLSTQNQILSTIANPVQVSSLQPSFISNLSIKNGSTFSSSILAFIRSHITPQRIVRLSLTCVQFGIFYYLAKSIWSAFCDIIDEIQQQEAEMGNQPGSGMREDHDLPFLSEEAVDLFTASQSTFCDKISNSNTTSNSNKRNSDSSDVPVKKKDLISGEKTNISNARKANMKRVSAKTTSMTSNLALRLHASGLPLSAPPNGSYPHQIKSVANILKSLTRTEGQLLSNTLLSPIDTKENFMLTSSADRLARVQEMWDDIGGLEDVKQALWDLVFPLLMSQQVKDDSKGQMRDSYYGGLLSNPPGVLLYGPPGCGKTLLVRALAHTANSRFLCVTPSNLLRKYVGETNLNIRALFSVARKISPCIIFIDEMEGIFRERGGSSTGGDEHDVSRELKTEFMQLWDGIRNAREENIDDQILIVGATNRPFDVDSAFLRRMPRSFFVGLPNYLSRVSILKTMLRNVPKDNNVDISILARVTEGYSPSDLKEVLRTAALIPLREARASVVLERQRRMNAGEQLPANLESFPPLRPLRMEDLLAAKEKVPSTPYSPSYRAALEEYSRRASPGRGNIFGSDTFHGHLLSGNPVTQRNFVDNSGSFLQNIHPIGDELFFTDAGTIHGASLLDQNADKLQNISLDDSSDDDYEDDDDESSSSSSDSSGI